MFVLNGLSTHIITKLCLLENTLLPLI